MVFENPSIFHGYSNSAMELFTYNPSLNQNLQHLKISWGFAWKIINNFTLDDVIKNFSSSWTDNIPVFDVGNLSGISAAVGSNGEICVAAYDRDWLNSLSRGSLFVLENWSSNIINATRVFP